MLRGCEVEGYGTGRWAITKDAEPDTRKMPHTDNADGVREIVRQNKNCDERVGIEFTLLGDIEKRSLGSFLFKCCGANFTHNPPPKLSPLYLRI